MKIRLNNQLDRNIFLFAISIVIGVFFQMLGSNVLDYIVVSPFIFGIIGVAANRSVISKQ
jgi:hypothetical protein